MSQIIVKQYNEVLFSLKREGNSDTCYTTAKPWGHYAKWNKPVTKGQILFDSTYVKYSRVVKLQRQKVGRNGKLMLKGYSLFCKMKKFL